MTILGWSTGDPISIFYIYVYIMIMITIIRSTGQDIDIESILVWSRMEHRFS